MLSHAYHLNQKHQIMITIRMIMMTITITIIFIHGQELENTRALTITKHSPYGQGSRVSSAHTVASSRYQGQGQGMGPHTAISTLRRMAHVESIFGCKDNGFYGFSTKH